MEVESYRARNHITVRGNDMPNPIQYFEESNFPDYLMKEIR
jgi:ATP-dependent RNA helicase DDX5/DBP2